MLIVGRSFNHKSWQICRNNSSWLCICYRPQRNCILLEKLRQEFTQKLESGLLCTALNSRFSPLSQPENRCQHYAFVLTPKSAVKCSRRTRRRFSTSTNSLIVTAKIVIYLIYNSFPRSQPHWDMHFLKANAHGLTWRRQDWWCLGCSSLSEGLTFVLQMVAIKLDVVQMIVVVQMVASEVSCCYSLKDVASLKIDTGCSLNIVLFRKF